MLFVGQFVLGGALAQRFAEYAHMVARVQAGDDHAVAFFGQECRGEALIAASAGALEWIEAYRVYRLHALLQALLDGQQIFLHLFAELSEVAQVGGDGIQGLAHVVRVHADDEAAHPEPHPNDQAQEDQSRQGEDDEAEQERV